VETNLAEKLTPLVRTMQIINAAMILAPVVFAGIVLVIGDQGPVNPAPLRGQPAAPNRGAPLETVGLVSGLAAIVVQGIAGRSIAAAGVKTALAADGDRVESLAGAYQTGLVVSLAINEGAAFLNLIAYMFSPNPWNLAMAGLLILANATKFPTVNRVITWVDACERRLKDEEQFGRP